MSLNLLQKTSQTLMTLTWGWGYLNGENSEKRK